MSPPDSHAIALLSLEFIFNTDCQVSLLLDAIKRAHGIPRTGVVKKKPNYFLITERLALE